MPNVPIPQPAPVPTPRLVADFEDFVRLFPGWNGRFEQLSRGRFEGTMKVVRGRGMYAHRVTTNRAIRVRGRETLGVMSVALVIPESAACHWQGRRLDPGRIVVRGGDVEANHQSSPSAVNVHFSVREARFREIVLRETGRDPGPMDWRAVTPSPGHFHTVESYVRQFLEESPNGPGARSPFEQDRLEDSCLTALADALFPSRGGPRHDRLPLAARAGVVRRAEDIMRGRLHDAVTEDELCRELGVRGRTLRLAFREHHGMGSAAYFQALRLNAARSAMKTGDEVGLSVADIARAWGFHHLGKFSGYYRRLFGELPSETLRRRCPSLSRAVA